MVELRLSLNRCQCSPACWFTPMLNRLTDALATSAATPSTRPVCHCLRVEEEEIRDAIDDAGCQTVRQVTAACGAGGGCTACHRHIKRYLAEAARAVEMQTEMEVVFGFA